MRVAATIYCILSVVAGLVYAPFFHVHYDHHAELHAHLDHHQEHVEPHHDDDAEAAAIEATDEEHHGTVVSVFVAQTPKVATSLTEIQETQVAAPAMTLIGFVVEQPVRAHDPPHLRISNPRSPPA